jgi:hypothetical protein
VNERLPWAGFLFIKIAPQVPDGWQSGLMRTPGKRVCRKATGVRIPPHPPAGFGVAIHLGFFTAGACGCGQIYERPRAIHFLLWPQQAQPPQQSGAATIARLRNNLNCSKRDRRVARFRGGAGHHEEDGGGYAAGVERLGEPSLPSIFEGR